MSLLGLILGLILNDPGPALADIGPAPAVRLIDASGKPFDLANLRGKAVLVSFVFTTCTGSCPATTFGMGRVQTVLKREGLLGSQVELVSITLDPERDTPEALARYARLNRADPAAWHFLTGPPEQVRDVIRAWSMWVKPMPGGGLDHPSRIFLVDARGRQREIYNLQGFKPELVVEDIRAALGE